MISTIPTESVSVKCFGSLDDLRIIEPFWKAHQWHPNTNFDFYTGGVMRRQNVIRPHVLAVFKDGELHGLIVGRLERGNAQIKVGYKTVLSPRMVSISVAYGGVLGTFSSEMAEAAIRELEVSLKRGDADRVWFNSLREGSELLGAVRNSSLPFSGVEHRFGTMHWCMSLPNKSDDFWARMKGKHRSELRRNERRLGDEFAGKLDFRSFVKPEDVGVACRDIEQVAKLTYLRGMNQGFSNSPEILERFGAAASRGCFRAYVMYGGGRPIGYWVGEIQDGSYFPTHTGYDPSLRKFEVGTLVLVHAVEELCAEGARKFDFGFGDALYKQHFGDEHWLDYSPTIFSPRLRCFLIRVAEEGSLRFSRFSSALLTKVGKLEWLKKRWRGNLSNAAVTRVDGPKN